ncbi:hypothetical protein [Streptomyces mirabilis]|uniref:hypothetical protein n=1 Tax=Streptomyces mirabilis TaxID=68239 RepID=UPI0036D909E1
MAPEEQAGGRGGPPDTDRGLPLGLAPRSPRGGLPVSGFAADLGHEPGQAARAHDVHINGVRNRAARPATGDEDGMVQLCTMVGALVLARATRGNPISEELLQAARTALTGSGTGQSEPRRRTA